LLFGFLACDCGIYCFLSIAAAWRNKDVYYIELFVFSVADIFCHLFLAESDI